MEDRCQVGREPIRCVCFLFCCVCGGQSTCIVRNNECVVIERRWIAPWRHTNVWWWPDRQAADHCTWLRTFGFVWNIGIFAWFVCRFAAFEDGCERWRLDMDDWPLAWSIYTAAHRAVHWTVSMTVRLTEVWVFCMRACDRTVVFCVVYCIESSLIGAWLRMLESQYYEGWCETGRCPCRYPCRYGTGWSTGLSTWHPPTQSEIHTTSMDFTNNTVRSASFDSLVLVSA